MTGISSKSAGGIKNKFQFLDREKQSEEFSDGSGLEEYDVGARFYDPQVGRFHSIDPLSEYMVMWSPYHYGFDNPIRFADADGLEPGDSTRKGDFRRCWCSKSSSLLLLVVKLQPARAVVGMPGG